MNRREFVGGSLAAGVAFGSSRFAESASPNRDMRLAIVGLSGINGPGSMGGRGRQLIEAFQKVPAAEDTLSEREAEVLGLLSKGYAEKEIADKMHVSVNTVKNHRKHIYQKLHLHSRTDVLLKLQGKR